MSYPVILYPKLLVDFRREHPLPSHQLFSSLERSAMSSSPTLESPQEVINHTATPDTILVSPTSTSVKPTMWIVSLGLVFGLLAFNEFTVKKLPQNSQQPIRVVSFLGAALAIAGVVGYNSPKSGISSSKARRIYSDEAVGDPMTREPARHKDPVDALNKNRHNGDKADSNPTGASRPDKARLLDYLELLKLNLHHAVIQPIGVSDAPVGRSEDAFASVLDHYFPGRVKRQLEFPIPQSEKGRSFSTDFAVVLEEIGLYIDVEIDEPFDLKKKRPTHCIDDYHDRYRNGFFLQGNWIIVRFAEEQVVRYPKSCCREIASVVAQVTGLDKFLKPLASEPILKPIPQWTKKQARAMAKSNYRDTYLPLLNSVKG
jgi:hypothetical protein